MKCVMIFSRITTILFFPICMSTPNGQQILLNTLYIKNGSGVSCFPDRKHLSNFNKMVEDNDPVYLFI